LGSRSRPRDGARWADRGRRNRLHHRRGSAAEAAPIVHAIVSLGRGLGMKVTAEGVETAEQHLFLRAAGVHFMQGYRFGQPDNAAAVAQRLATQAHRIANPVVAARAG
jgi:EAL domain-containing protein (putative c-di-GMP-specific phosphodiesterase class I)